ncbi:MAG: DUF6125 family protein [Candidatus Bathyarchaeia archaeon]
MNRVTNQDRQMLKAMPQDKLLDLFFLHIRNLWRIDGLYFLGIEKKFGTEAATEIDTNCWSLMGKLEARNLKTLLKIRKNDVASLMHALRNTSWALDHRNKEVEVSQTKGIFRVVKCHTQLTRIHKGLEVFPCKNVRFTYLKAFAEEFNPNIEVECSICPPDERPPNVWCEWKFKLKKTT